MFDMSSLLRGRVVHVCPHPYAPCCDIWERQLFERILLGATTTIATAATIATIAKRYQTSTAEVPPEHWSAMRCDSTLLHGGILPLSLIFSPQDEKCFKDLFLPCLSPKGPSPYRDKQRKLSSPSYPNNCTVLRPVHRKDCPQ